MQWSRFFALSMMMQSLLIYASDTGEQQPVKLTLKDCFTQHQTRVPLPKQLASDLVLTDHVKFFCKTAQVYVKCTVPEKLRRKYFAPKGFYHYREVQGWIGFVESDDEKLIQQCIDHVIPTLPFKQDRHQYIDKDAEIKKALKAYFKDRPEEVALLKIALEFYDEHFDGSIIAPSTLHEIYKDFHLDINNTKHVKLLQECTDSLSHACISFPYLKLDPAKEHAYILQERNGERPKLIACFIQQSMRIPKPTGTYPTYIKAFCKRNKQENKEVQAWIGFVEGKNKVFVNEVIRNITSFLPFKKYAQQFIDESLMLEEARDACRSKFISRSTEFDALKITAIFYDTHFDGRIIAPQSLHEHFTSRELDINDTKDREHVYACAQHGTGRYMNIPYFTIDRAQEAAYLLYARNTSNSASSELVEATP